MSYSQDIMPSTDKLFMYIRREKWHNVTPASTNFVKKEFTQHLNELQEDEKDYKDLRLMIEHAEAGRYTNAKEKLPDADKQFQHMVTLLTEKRQGLTFSPRQTSRHGQREENNVQTNRGIYTPNYVGNQDTYRDLPNRLETPRSPLKDANQDRIRYSGREPPRSPLKDQNRRDTPPRSPMKPQENLNRMETPKSPMKNNQQSARYTIGTPARSQASRGGTPRSPLKQNGNEPAYDSEEDRKEQDKRHKENYQILRVHSPDKRFPQQNTHRFESPIPQTPGSNRGQTPNMNRDPHRVDSYKHGDADQQASHRDIWGLDYGDTDKEKERDSTYRKSFPKHDIELLERQDKLRYRNNFNSLAERETWFRHAETPSDDRSRKGSGLRRSPNKRMLETPDANPHTVTELAKKFRDLYLKEWQDAYDEICKTFGPERTTRHLLWIVTECSLIANEIASAQMRDLERSAFGVMRTPGPDKDHPSDTALPRNMGETIPKSRTLLIRYRRQTADISIPYVKEECQNKICDILLLEPSNFPRTFLSKNSRLVAYINKCAEITWLLCVQDPPIILEYVTKNQEGSRFNNDLYSQYTKPGRSYDYGVWPLLRQDKGGHIVSKGVAQGI